RRVEADELVDVRVGVEDGREQRVRVRVEGHRHGEPWDEESPERSDRGRGTGVGIDREELSREPVDTEERVRVRIEGEAGELAEAREAGSRPQRREARRLVDREE